MENKWIYIDEITTLHAMMMAYACPTSITQLRLNPHTLVDWLPNIIEVAFQQKEKQDKEKIEELKNIVNETI